MLDLIEMALDETKRGWQRLRMDGSINKVAERKALVDEYNSNSNIFLFLMTTQVGGVGITLTSADRVVIFDPAWNTAMDDQAADRIYRIGQTRDVIIYRLISSGTIEEKMYRKQVFKGALSKSLLGKEAAVHTYFTRGELRELFIFSPEEIREPKTQNLLSSLHSHKRDTYPALEQELNYLSQLSTLVGITDHNLLYTEEASQIKSHAELDEYAAGAHLALSKTIAPKDVVESEQKEAAIRMARGQRGPVTTIYIDDDSAPRPRRDPSQVGTRVGDITLLSVDDQFELGLFKMKVTQEKTRKNPFSSAPRSRPGHNFGGNDRVSALPTVKRSSDTNTTAKKTSPAPSNVPKKSGAPVTLPTVSTKTSTSSATNTNKNKDSTKPTPQLPVVIKKSGSVLPTPSAQPKPSEKPSSTAVPSTAFGDDTDDLLAGLMDNVSITHTKKKPIASDVPSSVKPVLNPPSTTNIPPSSAVKPRNRRIIEEDDDDLPEPAPIMTAQSSLGSVRQDQDSEDSEDSSEYKSASEDESDDISQSLVSAVQSVNLAPESSAVEVDDRSNEDDVLLPLSPLPVKPKAPRKSIITFDVAPDENMNEAFVMEAETLDEELEKHVSDDEDTASDSEDGSGSECSEASETEFSIMAAQADRSGRSTANKHFLDSTGNETDEEEAGAEDIGDDEDDESESTVASDDGSSLDSFIASEDEEEDAEDDVVDVDEHELVIQRILSAKKNERNLEAISPASKPVNSDDVAPIVKKSSNGVVGGDKGAKSVDANGKEAIHGNVQKNGHVASSQPDVMGKVNLADGKGLSSKSKADAMKKGDIDEKEAGQGSSAKSAGVSAHTFSFTRARTKRRIVESDDEE